MDYRRLRNLVKSDDNIALVREYLQNGVDPNRIDGFGETLLHVAAKSVEDNIKIVQELINAGGNVSICNKFLFKPLQFAVIRRKRRVVEALLKSTVRVNSGNYFGMTALHYAVNNNVVNGIQAPDTPLNVLVPDLWIVRKLLDHRLIDVNRDNISGTTPLMQAIKDKQIEIVKLLLEKNLKADACDKFQQTALHMALEDEDSCPYIVVLLLLKRATLLRMNCADKTPLNIIIHSKPFEFACVCLRIIAFRYDINGLVKNKLLKIPDLYKFLNTCYAEINRMKRDIIRHELTVFDFFLKSFLRSSFRKPVSYIYKPVVEKIISGLYPEYCLFLLNRISKSKLSEVLKVLVKKKYCNRCKDCTKEPSTAVSEIMRLNLLFDYVSRLDIFCLIMIFTNVNVDESMLNIRERNCYLTDSWEEYPDTYFD